MKNQSSYSLWQELGNPKYALAPMVDINDLPFRILCRKYNTHLTFTQMYNITTFINDKNNRLKILNDINNSLDNPCIIQFCGHDPELLLKSAQIVQSYTKCIDLNLGCPQNIAKRGHYGSFLLDHPDEVYKILGYIINNKINISCKIRLYENLDKTYEFVKKIEEIGIKFLTVHGRTKLQKGENVGKCNWDAIKNIKNITNIPIIANGGIGTWEDIDKCFEYTGCDCVMCGEKMIENPTFFSRKEYDIDDICLEYLDIWNKYENNIEVNMSGIRGHMFKWFYTGCKAEPKFNQKIALVKNLKEACDVAKEMKEFRKNWKLDDKFGWYKRYFNKNKKNNNENISDINNCYNDNNNKDNIDNNDDINFSIGIKEK